jgi:hypothetical protein
LGSSYQERGVRIQLSERRVDPVIREEGWDHVIKRGGLIQLSERRVDSVIREEGWDPVIREEG